MLASWWLNVINRFFVYVHRKASTGEVFYVGKGTINNRDPYLRAHVTRKRSAFWLAITEKHGLVVDVVMEFDSEVLAFQLERDLIEHYGRRCDGEPLCNLTSGGDGQLGLAKSQETLRKLSEAFSGERHFNWGKKLSAETCRRKSESMKASPKNLKGKKLPPEWKAKIAATKQGSDNPMYGKRGSDHPRSRSVLLHGYNIVFESISEAAKFVGIPMAMLHAHLNGITKVNKTNMELI